MDPFSVQSARGNVERNNLQSQIVIEQVAVSKVGLPECYWVQTSPEEFLCRVVNSVGSVDFCMCNPPFFETKEQAMAQRGPPVRL